MWFAAVRNRVGASHTVRRAGRKMLQLAPWVVLGPISGFLSGRAIRCYRSGDRVLAVLYVILNIIILIALPSLTAMLAAQSGLGEAGSQFRP